MGIETGLSDLSVAYVLKECNENEKAIVVKNDKYYDADSVTMPQITFLVMSDTDAQALAFKNNEIDIALSITRDDWQKLIPNPGEIWNKPRCFQLLPGDQFRLYRSGNNLQNVDVRRALALAIDKDALGQRCRQF